MNEYYILDILLFYIKCMRGAGWRKIQSARSCMVGRGGQNGKHQTMNQVMNYSNVL